jgi:hypothetical protein
MVMKTQFNIKEVAKFYNSSSKERSDISKLIEILLLKELFDNGYKYQFEDAKKLSEKKIKCQ